MTGGQHLLDPTKEFPAAQGPAENARNINSIKEAWQIVEMC